jgi:hypothetical protein
MLSLMSGSFLLNILIVISSLGHSAIHPLHVSVTEMEWDEKDKALEIMMRVFMDDLELAFRQRYANPALDILNPGEPTLDKMMATYLNERFSVSIDGKKQTLNYLGHERDGEAFVFYIEIGRLKKWNRIRVANTIMMELYDDQSHLVHVTVSGKIRSLRLTKSNSSGELSF